MNIGDKIKEIRKSKGLTQEELANRCELSKNGLWNYENNKRQVNMEILSRIAAALDVEIDDLLGRDKVIYSQAIQEIENFIEKYPENETAIAETVRRFSECLFCIYVKKGHNNRDLATSNINLFNDLISKINELLERDIVFSPFENPILYTKSSLDNISEITKILNQLMLNRLAMYSLKKSKEGE